MTDEKDSDGIFLPADKRVTAIGRVLRKTSLDEIPQFVNVLKGEMSLVGPRPLLPYYQRLYNDNQIKRNNVKPGITGIAQISGGNHITWYSRFRLDVWYTEHIAFLVDVAILLKTITFLFAKKPRKIHGIPEDFTGNPNV